MKPKLNNLNPAPFVRSHWQKKPLFLPGALPPNFLTLKPSALFALAAREEVESRLISRSRSQNRWRYRAADGPFEAATLEAKRARKHWTLLIQRTNEWLPNVDLLFEYFAFLPNWRLDDIMVSYATPGGTVGPHLDNYDVFLCQLQGNRTWEFSAKPSRELLEKNQPVRILTNFSADHKFTARPGDVLYIPPGVGHYGVADTESITVSVGFRAPQVSRLTGIYFEEAEHQLRQRFYQDPGMSPVKNSGEIRPTEIKKLFTLGATKPALSREKYTDALLKDLSVTPNSILQSGEGKLSKKLFETRWRKQNLQRNPRNHFFYRVTGKTVALYTAGESFVFPRTLLPSVKLLCNNRILPYNKAAAGFLHEAYAMGLVFFQK